MVSHQDLERYAGVLAAAESAFRETALVAGRPWTFLPLVLSRRIGSCWLSQFCKVYGVYAWDNPWRSA